MPKFPDLLLNNNPDAPSIDLNDLQVKGVGIFADKAERDLLDPNIQTEGYLSIMKDDDNLYVYIGGGWTTATNWVRVSGTLQVAEVDGSPIGDVSVLAFPPSTLTITGPVATVNLSGYATAPQLAALQTEVDNIETALGIEITGIAPPTDPGDILISDGTNFGVSVYSLPTTDGSAGQFLQTDGLGNVSFATISATLEGLTDTPSGYGTAGQVLITNGVDGFTFGSGSLWEEVAYTGQTAIKYENGVVGIKASGTTYSTNSNLLAKAGQFPINTGSYSTTISGVDALMHLHEGRIIYTTDNSATGAVAMSMLGTSHATTDIGQIGLYSKKAWISGGEGVYLGSSSVSGISTYITSPGTSGIIKIGSQNFDSAGGIQLSGDTGPASNYHKIVMGGQIIFHGHTASKYVAISRRGSYGTDGGVQISGGQRTGLFAHFAASDPNTQGTYGYLGINVNTPTVGGPAFEVSSSYAKFNSGLHIGDITTTGYAFPTATGTLDQVLKVDANGDLVFGADNAGLWTVDTNGINYQAGNVGIGAASTAGDKLSIAGRLSVLSHITQDANNDGNYNIVIGNINNTSALADNNCVIIGNSNTLGASNATQTVVIGRNKNVSSRSYRHTDIGAQSGSTYIDGSGSATGQVAIQSAAGSYPYALSIGGTISGNYAVAIGGGSGAENVTVGNASYSSYGPNWSAVIGRQIARFHTGGDSNVLAGYRAAYGSNSSSVSNSVLIGRQAANNSSTNTNNVMVGYKAGYSTTTGSSNVFLGYEAGYYETGSNKLYIENSNSTTPLIYGEFDNNIVKINGSYSGGAIGLFPQNGNTNSYVAIGDQNYFDAGAGSSPSKGLHILFDSTFTNTGYGTGVQIGHSWNMGYFSNDNVAIGNRFTSTATNSSHVPKIMIGNGIDLGATTNNAGGIIIGASSLPGNMGGGVVIGGTGAAFNGVAILATGHEGSQGGTAILGEAKGYSVTIGASAGRAGVGSSASGQKVYVGINAGSNSAMTTAVGANAGRNMTGFYNTALGANAIGLAVSSGASANTAVGDSAGYNLTGSANTFVGARAAISTTSGSSNVALGGGLGAGTSPALTANTTGSHNISLGINSLETAVSASRNIALGTDAGKRAGGNNNIFLGYRIAHVGTDNNTSISDNIVLGYQAGHNLAGSKNVLIGYEAGKNETGSNKLYISHSDTTTPLIYGEFDNDIVTLNAGVSITGSRIVNAKTVGLDVVYNGALIGSTNNNGTSSFPATWEFAGGVTNGNSFGSTFWIRPGGNANAFNSAYQSQIINNGYNLHMMSGTYQYFYLGNGNSITHALAKTLRVGGASVNVQTLKVGTNVDAPNFTFPNVDGTANQVIVTDGAGQGSWATPYTQKYESVATAKVGNSTQTETGTVAFVERYYTAKKDGDAVASSSYTGAGTRRLFYAPKYNADATKIESQDNPEGWIMVNTGTEWTVGSGEYDTLTVAQQNNLALDDTVNTQINYATLLEQYMGHKNYSDSAEVTFAVVVIPTVITINSGADSSWSVYDVSGDVSNPSKLAAGTTIDWGDGNVDTIASDITTNADIETALSHTYAAANTDYTITINGFARNIEFGVALATPQATYGDQKVKSIKLGTQVRFGEIASCYNLSSVLGRMFFKRQGATSVVNPLPQSFADCVRLNAVNMEHFYDPYQYVEPRNQNSQRWLYVFKNVSAQYNPNCKARIRNIYNFGIMDQLSSYSVDFTNGSAVATRSGGLDFKIVEGREIVVNGKYYTIQSIDSTTQFTLTSNFLDATGSYDIEFKFPMREFTSLSNWEVLSQFTSSLPNSQYDLDSMKEYPSEAYISMGNGTEHAIAEYPPATEKYFNKSLTKYICDGVVRCTNGSTTIQADNSWQNIAIPSRPTGSVDVTFNSKIVTATSGELSIQFLKGYQIEIDGNLYEIDTLDRTQLTLTTNFTGTTGTYTATSMITPPVQIHGVEYIVRSIDTVAKTIELCTVFLGITGDYRIEALGWDTAGVYIADAFNNIRSSNPVIKNLNFKNQGVATTVNYQRFDAFAGDNDIINPNLSGWKFATSPRQVTTGNGVDISQMFYNCKSFNTNSLANWDTTGVGSMKEMFRLATSFNGDIEGWDVSNVHTFTSMFSSAYAFNRDISGWDTSNARYMNGMFNGATSFNQDLSSWDVNNVRSMASMFAGGVYQVKDATIFNQDISSWDTSNVTSMNKMFQGNMNFNQPIGSWDVSNVTDIANIFDTRTVPDAFDQDLSGWDIGSVTTMAYLHQGGSAWSIDNLSKTLNGWTVSSNMTNMIAVFAGTYLGHVDLSHWDVSGVVGNGFSSFNSYSAFSQIEGLGSWNVNPNASTWAVGDPIDSSVHVTDLNSFRRFGGNGTIDTKSFSVANGSNVFTLSPDQELTADYTIGKYMHYSVGASNVFSNNFYFTITSISADRTQITVDTNYTGTTGTTNLNLKYKTPYAVRTWEVRTVGNFGAMFDGGLFETDVSSWKLWSCTSVSKLATGATPLAAETAMAAWSQDPYTNTGVNANTIWGNATVTYGKALTAGSAGHKGYIKLAAPTPLSFNITGTADSVSSLALNDSTTDFVAGGVLAGMLVVNTTTNAFSSVTVVATNSLTLSDDIFTSNDAYSIEGGYGWTFTNVEFA